MSDHGAAFTQQAGSATDPATVQRLYLRALWGRSDVLEKLQGFKPAARGFERAALVAAAWHEAQQQGTALAEAGYRTARGADPGRGERLLAQGLAVLETAGTGLDRARCHKYLCFVRLMQGRIGDALAEIDRAITGYRAAGDEAAATAALNNKGNVLLQAGRVPEARQCFEAALAFGRQRADLFLESVALSNLAMTFAREERYEQALPVQRQAALLRQRLNDLVALASASLNLGNIYHMLGRNEEGSGQWQLAEQLSTKLGDLSTVASIKYNRAELCHNHGDDRAAHALYGATLDIRLAINAVPDLPKTVVRWVRSGLQCGGLGAPGIARARQLLERLAALDTVDEDDLRAMNALLNEIGMADGTVAKP